MLRPRTLLAALGLALLAAPALRAQTTTAPPAEPAPAAAVAALPADSLVGTWSYLVETPDGSFAGRMAISMTEAGALAARLLGDAAGTEGLDVRDVAFDGRLFTGTFTNPQYGDIRMELTFEPRRFGGNFVALAMGATVPASGQKL